MTRPNVKIVDAETGEEIIREMNDEEYAVHLEDLARLEERKKAEEAAIAKREAALAKLAALGLTTDDLSALGL